MSHLLVDRADGADKVGWGLVVILQDAGQWTDNHF